jgi:AcrR family transcriptional regulator
MNKHPSEDRRRQIMEAALPVFAAKGFRGATNRDIAQAAGITTSLIYWYFQSKEDLFTAILDEMVPIGEFALPLAQMTEAPPEEVLPFLAQGVFLLIQHSPFFLIMRILVAESMQTPEMGRRFNTIFIRILDPLVVYLQAQIARGRLRAEDPLLMAQTFISSLGFFLIRRMIGLDETMLQYDPQTVSTFVLQTFLRAFAVESPPTEITSHPKEG